MYSNSITTMIKLSNGKGYTLADLAQLVSEPKRSNYTAIQIAHILYVAKERYNLDLVAINVTDTELLNDFIVMGVSSLVSFYAEIEPNLLTDTVNVPDLYNKPSMKALLHALSVFANNYDKAIINQLNTYANVIIALTKAVLKDTLLNRYMYISLYKMPMKLYREVAWTLERKNLYGKHYMRLLPIKDEKVYLLYAQRCAY